jgi:hypothetical protein
MWQVPALGFVLARTCRASVRINPAVSASRMRALCAAISAWALSFDAARSRLAWRLSMIRPTVALSRFMSRLPPPQRHAEASEAHRCVSVALPGATAPATPPEQT